MIKFVSVVLALLVWIGTASANDANAFADKVNLRTLELIEVQHNQTLKTFDTFARQTLANITGKPSLDGQPATYIVMDMMFRPEGYFDRNIIRIKSAPLRKDFETLTTVDKAERDRILKEGTLSMVFLNRPDVREFLVKIQSTAAFKNDAVNHLLLAQNDLAMLLRGDFRALRIIPPGTPGGVDRRWHDLSEVLGNIAGNIEEAHAHGHAAPTPADGYEGKETQLAAVGAELLNLKRSWGEQNADAVNAHLENLSQAVIAINPEVYPSKLKRSVEVLYNRLTKLTIPGAALYFAAFVCFVMSAYSGVLGLRLWGLRLFILAFIVHSLGIAIRWWLVEKNVGNWFEAIPIKNQFESVLFSAWFGALVGLFLETRKSRGIFGAAASFVGWLSLTAIFATPYVVGREIGGEIQQVSGVLMSYWLYIHVTAVVASYALIGMSFALAIWWLIRYYRTDKADRPRVQKVDASNPNYTEYDGGATPVVVGGAIALGFWKTLAMTLFVSRAKQVEHVDIAPAKPAALLHTLDMCNLVILQLAFWILGGGIILGAIWADQSWGRPWGWDPKETFALVTWIVYLLVVHIRIAARDKAWWTAVLSIVGFFVMLFNWIGVNFFLVGLHSYA